MREEFLMNTDTIIFFNKQPDALPLYEAFADAVTKLYPETEIRVQKTQISFYDVHMFACVSFVRVKKKKELPEPYLVVTLGMPYPLESPRVAVKTEPYPGRWTTHIVIGETEEIDGELLSWLKEAHDFAINK